MFGVGFCCGVYICKCVKGYFFLNSNVEEKFYKGYDIEVDVDFVFNNMMLFYKYSCIWCVLGCDVCIDMLLCLFIRNVVIKVFILILIFIVIVFIIIVLGIIFCLKESKVIEIDYV